MYINYIILRKKMGSEWQISLWFFDILSRFLETQKKFSWKLWLAEIQPGLVLHLLLIFDNSLGWVCYKRVSYNKMCRRPCETLNQVSPTSDLVGMQMEFFDRKCNGLVESNIKWKFPLGKKIEDLSGKPLGLFTFVVILAWLMHKATQLCLSVLLTVLLASPTSATWAKRYLTNNLCNLQNDCTTYHNHWTQWTRSCALWGLVRLEHCVIQFRNFMFIDFCFMFTVFLHRVFKCNCNA